MKTRYSTNYCLNKAVESESKALEMKALGDVMAAYAFRQEAEGWLTEALETEAQTKADLAA